MPDIVDLRRRIDELAGALLKCLRNFLTHERTRLRFLSERTLARELLKRLRDAQQQIDLTRETLDRHLVHKIDNCRIALTDLHRRFVSLPSRLYENAHQRFRRVEGILRVLGPDATLRRGYSITTDESGKVIKSVRAVRAKMKIRTRVSDGEFGSTVSSG